MRTSKSPLFGPFTSAEPVAPTWSARVQSCTVAELDDAGEVARRVIIPRSPRDAWVAVWHPLADVRLEDLRVVADTSPPLCAVAMVIAIDHASVGWAELLPQHGSLRLAITAAASPRETINARSTTGSPAPSSSTRAAPIVLDGLHYEITYPRGYRYCTFLTSRIPLPAAPAR